MKQWRVEFGTNHVYVDAETEEGAIDAAFLAIGYDPDDELIAYCENEDD